MPFRPGSGFRLVLAPGKAAHQRYRGDPEPASPARVCDLPREPGFADGVPRARNGILATIANRSGNPYEGSIPG